MSKRDTILYYVPPPLRKPECSSFMLEDSPSINIPPRPSLTMDAPTSSSLCLSHDPAEETAMDRVSTGRRRPPLARDLLLANIKSRSRTSSTSSETKEVGFANPRAWRPSLPATTDCDEPSSRKPCRIASRKSVGHAHPRPFRPKPGSDDNSVPETTGHEQELPEPTRIAGDHSLYVAPGPWPRDDEVMKGAAVPSVADTTKTRPCASHDSAPAPKGTGINSSTSQSMVNMSADETWYRQEQGVSRGYVKRTFEKCICNRPHTTVVCHVCGYSTIGRLRLYCPQHSNYTFLMDLLLCPKCKAYPCMMREVWPRVVRERRPGKQ